MIDPNAAVNFIIKTAPLFAEAKANRVYLEEFLKSKRALLMAESGLEAVNKREQYAYAHDEYLTLLEGYKQAVAVEEKLKWELVAAQLRTEIWRSMEATNRNQDKAAR